MSEEQRWASSARESFAVALEHLRSRIRPLRAEIAELAARWDAKQEELAPLEQVEAELEKWCLESARGTANSTTTGNAIGGDDSDASPGGSVVDRASGQPTRCELIIGVMSQEPRRQWRPRDVASGLGEENVNTVRSLMQYLAGRGRLCKNPDASYQLPETSAQADQVAPSAMSGQSDADGQENVMHAPFGRSRRPHTVAVDPEQVLLFLRKNAGRRWRPAEVGAHLEIPDADAVRRTLQELAGRGLLVKHNYGRFQYVPPGNSAGRAV